MLYELMNFRVLHTHGDKPPLLVCDVMFAWILVFMPETTGERFKAFLNFVLKS